MWTRKHQQFSKKSKLTPSARDLWEWLVHQSKEGTYAEPDLRDFNRWVERWRGKGYCNKTLKTAIAQLAERGIVELVKTFAWHTSRLLLRSIAYLMPSSHPGKKVQKVEKVSSSGDSNAETVNDALIQQQHSSPLRQFVDSIWHFPLKMLATESTTEVVELCNNNGLPFTNTRNLVEFSIYEVKRAILYYWQTGVPLDMWNPQGWLIRCLQEKWWAAPVGDRYPPDYTIEEVDELIPLLRNRHFRPQIGG